MRLKKSTGSYKHMLGASYPHSNSMNKKQTKSKTHNTMKPTISHPKRAAIISACLFLIACSAQAITFVQWNPGAGGNGHLYGVTDSASDWLTAENVGISLGGHLTSITSVAEQSFITTTFLTGAFDSIPLWVGMTDNSPYGGGVGSKVYSFWTTGEPVAYTNWLGGEPNNTAPGEDYGTINWGRASGADPTKGLWNDTPLNGTTGFAGTTNGPYFGVVEVVPEPSSVALLLSGFAFFLRRRTLRTHQQSA